MSLQLVCALYVLISTLQISEAIVNCDDYYECAGQLLAESTNCYGFGSCSFATISSDYGLNCDGDRSCYSATLELAESIKCRSTASCESASITTSDELHCEGCQSCANSVISAESTAYLYGHYAAVNSRIEHTSTVRAYGYYSLLFATIDSAEMDSLTVKLYGVDAGYGASVVCRAGSTCSLLCKGGGCGSLDFLCFAGSSCSVSPEQCLEDNSVDSSEGVTCPQWAVSASEGQDTVLEQVMAQKETERESDKKWALWQNYIADDLALWETRDEGIDGAGMEKVLNVVRVHGENALSVNVYLSVGVAIGATVAVLIIVTANCCCYENVEKYEEL